MALMVKTSFRGLYLKWLQGSRGRFGTDGCVWHWEDMLGMHGQCSLYQTALGF
jgi:hypothetical protein